MNFNEYSDAFSILSKYEAKLGRTYPSIAFDKVSKMFKTAHIMTNDNNKVYLDDKALGASSSSVIIELQKTGKSERLEIAKAELTKFRNFEDIPVGEITGIGSTKSEILRMHGVKTVKDLLGVKPEVGKEISNTGVNFTNMMDAGLRLINKTKGVRLTYDEALQLYNKIRDKLLYFNITQFTYAGSLRRKKSTIGDLDLIFIVNDYTRDIIIETVKQLYDELLVEGEKKISGVINNFQVDMRFIEEKEFGCHLLHATGSSEFNQRIRSHAKSLGLKLNEYCIYKYDTEDTYYFNDEESIFKFLGLNYIPPELR